MITKVVVVVFHMMRKTNNLTKSTGRCKVEDLLPMFFVVVVVALPWAKKEKAKMEKQFPRPLPKKQLRFFVSPIQFCVDEIRRFHSEKEKEEVDWSDYW